MTEFHFKRKKAISFAFLVILLGILGFLFLYFQTKSISSSTFLLVSLVGFYLLIRAFMRNSVILKLDQNRIIFYQNKKPISCDWKKISSFEIVNVSTQNYRSLITHRVLKFVDFNNITIFGINMDEIIEDEHEALEILAREWQLHHSGKIILSKRRKNALD